MKTVLSQVEEMRKNNPKIAKAWDIFERAQKIYDKTMKPAYLVSKRHISKGTYSTSISKKEYHADVSTTCH